MADYGFNIIDKNPPVGVDPLIYGSKNDWEYFPAELLAKKYGFFVLSGLDIGRDKKDLTVETFRVE